jgi:hypothetical protein
MLPTVSSPRPVDLLRASSDQIRRAVAMVAQLTEETADPSERLAMADVAAAGSDPALEAERQNTILTAQRSFAAGLRLAQLGERETSR